MSNDDGSLTRHFLRAAELGPEQRRRFLERLRRSAPTLCSDLESLLRQHDRTPPSVLRSGGLFEVGWPPEVAPERIGPYRVLSRIGEGGMGIVYRVEQRHPLRRQAALKLIRQGLQSDRLIARFDAERRVLALLDHPNIARVLDAGIAEDGRPYVVMELVDGEPITDFCDRRRLDVDQRLRLFHAVCQAVHHAHRHAIIHRDIKPSNLLVTMVDGNPVPKVIDFGIAKALSPEPDPDEGLTEVGQLIGTLPYMSPEQAARDPRAIDIRTDVYSLGAVLHELLVGCPPVDAGRLRAAGADGLHRILLEQAAPQPSVRLLALGHRAAAVAEGRATETRALARRLRGDLDCIALRALAPERSRRYGTAEELGAEVLRFLRHEPVQARPPSLVYRIRKAARRHRTAAAVAATLLPVLLAAAVVLAAQAHRVAQERDRAEEIADFLVGFYEVPYFVIGRHGPIGPSEILTRSAEKIERDLADRPLMQARLRHTTGAALDGAGQSARAASLLEQAHETLREILGQSHSLTLAALRDLGRAYQNLGRFRESEASLVAALEGERRTLGPDDLDTLRTAGNLAALYKQLGRYEEAARLLVPTLAGLRRARGEEHVETLVTGSVLAAVFLDLGRLDEAEALLTDILPRLEQDHPERGMALYNLGCVYARKGRREEALASLDAAAQAGFFISYFADANLEPLWDDPEFIAIARTARIQHPRAGRNLSQRAAVLAAAGREEDAEALYRYVIDTLPARPRWRSTVAWFEEELATLYLRQGRYEDARPLAEDWVEWYREGFGPDAAVVALQMWYLVQVHVGLGQTKTALAMLDEQVRILESQPTPVDRALISYAKASRSALLGDGEEALRQLERALAEGYWSPQDCLARDLCFEMLRDTPEFQTLLALHAKRYGLP